MAIFRWGAHDESPVSTSGRTPDMPLDQQWRYATGNQCDLNEDLTIGAAYTFLDAGDAAINQSAVDNPLRGELIGGVFFKLYTIFQRQYGVSILARHLYWRFF